MRCNLCGSVDFTDMGNRSAVCCVVCHSLERTRMLWMYLKDYNFTPETRVLHLAPERGMYSVLKRRISPGNYCPTDIDPAAYPYVEEISRLDLCELETLPSNHFDLIVHAHVLEHVPCNIAVPLFHLHRSLKPTGLHVFVVPFLSGGYEESFADIGVAERTRKYGQADHLRRFGRNDIQKHLGSLLKVDVDFDATQDFSTQELLDANIPERCWRGLSPDTVFKLGKYDMKLLARHPDVGSAGSQFAYGIRAYADVIDPRELSGKNEDVMTDTDTTELGLLAAKPQAVDHLVSSARHPDDGMYRGNLQHYQGCGRDALRNCALALMSSNAGVPTRIMDFACGFGRVARYLRAAFPKAELCFSDAMAEATSFCASTFRGENRQIAKDFSNFSRNSKFDLIWVGSLFTHLDENKSIVLLRLLYSVLAENGVLVATTHGRYVEARRHKGGWPYAIDAAGYDALIESAVGSGYGFEPYPGMVDYGISLTKFGWWDSQIGGLPGAETVMYRERGWDRHQDVIALAKRV